MQSNTIKFLEASFSETSHFPKANRDSFGIYVGRFGRLYIVSRDIGPENTDILSKIAVISIKEHFESLPPEYNTHREIAQAFKVATKEVLSYTTEHSWVSNSSAAVGLLLYNSEGVFAAHAGDCRIFLLRGQKISAITTDHLTTGETSDLMDNVGISNVEPEIIPNIDIYEGDCMLIATRGVYQRATRQEMLVALSGEDLLESINLLWTVAKDKKSNDDFTLIALKATQAPAPPLEPQVLRRELRLQTFLVFLLGFSLLVLGLTVYSVW